jgi:hypothetical protein
MQSVHPVIHPAPNPFYNPRSYYTFGTILPRIIEQSCARDIPLLLHYYYFIIMMFERFNALCIYSYCVSLTIHHNQQQQSCVLPAHILHTSGTHPAHIRHTILRTSGTHPAPNPFYIRGLILPSVRSYRGL